MLTLTPDLLMQNPKLGRLDKSGRELVLELVKALVDAPAPRSNDGALLKQWQRIKKDNPTPRDIFVSSLLTDLSIAYIQDLNQFAASGVTPIGVQQQAGQFNKYDRGDSFRADPDSALRPPATESAGSGFRVTQGSYLCDVYAQHKDVDDQLEGNQQTGDPVDDAMAAVLQWLWIIRDTKWAAKLFATGLWGIDLDGVSGAPGGGQFQQFDESGSLPRRVFSTNAVAIHEKTGQWPNQLTLSPHVLTELILHAEVVDAFKHTTAGAVPSMQALAQTLFTPSVAGGVPPMIKIVGGVKTTSAEGAATTTTAYIGGKHALLSYVNPNPGLRTRTAWSIFAWQGFLGANAFGIRMKDFPIEHRAITHRVEGEMAFDANLVDATLGAFFENAVP